MTKTKVVNLRKENYDVYIGRPSIYGNPYRVGIDGTREEVIEMYERYARRNKEIMQNIPSLVGKKLGCFCKPKRCHGDVLVKLISEFLAEQRQGEER